MCAGAGIMAGPGAMMGLTEPSEDDTNRFCNGAMLQLGWSVGFVA